MLFLFAGLDRFFAWIQWKGKLFGGFAVWEVLVLYTDPEAVFCRFQLVLCSDRISVSHDAVVAAV